MALRLLVYVGLLYQRLIDERQIGPRDILPPVLPLVLYNGAKRWTAPLDVADLLAECPEELARYGPRMRYFLLDEHRTDDAELSGMRHLAALIFRFEQCRTRADFKRVIDALRAWAAAPEHRESLKRLAQWVEMIVSRGRLSGGTLELGRKGLDGRQDSGRLWGVNWCGWKSAKRSENTCGEKP